MSLKNKIITAICEKIVFPGRSLCRCDDGIALFTEGLLPEEHADILVVRDKRSFREGLVKKVTFKSSERTSPLCPSFGLCGGCSFQNTLYTNQIKYKQKYISELLYFTGIRISKILISPNKWFYRNKMEFSFFYSSDGLVNDNFETDLGLHHRGSFNKYVSVPPCFIADKDFLRAIEIVKKFANRNNISVYNNKTHVGFFRHLVLRKARNNNQFLINIVTSKPDQEQLFLELLVKELADFTDSVYWTINSRESDAVVADKTTLMHGKSYITEKLNIDGKDYFFNISPLSFFQINSKGTEVLYNEVLKLLNPSREDVLLDLYCGTGTIGIFMAHSVKKVIGIEQVEQSIEDAKENAAANNIFNAEFYAMTAEQWVNQNGSIFDIIVADPPRSGFTKNVINFLLDSGAKRIVYVSCNPPTLARDLQIIIEKNIYNVKKITPIDMFPQTHHVEVVVLLELKQ
jgi:23S rRNA (uracil-5-)-methyltransferase RumA